MSNETQELLRICEPLSEGKRAEVTAWFTIELAPRKLG
jgi:hypothetical protein